MLQKKQFFPGIPGILIPESPPFVYNKCMKYCV